MSKVITIERVYFGCGIVPTVDLLNNTTRVFATKNARLVDHQHNTSCTLPNWQWHCDNRIIKRQQRHCPNLTYNAIHLTVSRIIHAIRFQSCGHSLRTPKELRALNDCWGNGWRWHLEEALTANDSVRCSSRSAVLWFWTPIIVHILCAWLRLHVEF